MSDPIVSEVRQSRKAIFARFGNDLHRLCAAIREREEQARGMNMSYADYCLKFPICNGNVLSAGV